ncbi:MAG: NusG domain II-containing protein [Clostridia bacterium]|nr:NusG domain II-containing protein [Clostridia bacterium]
MKKIKLFSRYDLLVLIAISALAIILLVPNLFASKSLTATITVDGEVIERVDLSSATGFREIKLESDPAVKVRIENGRICVVEAECEDKLCVNCGWLESDGAMAVCLPAKVVVSVDGSKASDEAPDVITY